MTRSFKILFGLVGILVVLVSTGVAFAQVPTLEPGRHVYTVPGQAFVPPMIGNEGMRRMETALARLHFPYYVVLVGHLPGSGDGDARAAQMVNEVAQAWATQFPSQYGETSSIFLLSFQPRKYRFIAGSRWVRELNFARAAHQPYTDIFVRYVRNTPADPLNGIIAMARSVDDYLFDQVDPARRAERARAARLAAERSARERAVMLAQASFFFKLLAEVLLVAVLLYALISRRRSYRRLASAWRSKIGNAELRYADFVERDTIASMSRFAGQSAILFREVTEEVDSIFLGVLAMKRHLEECEALARKAFFFNFLSLINAQEKLNAEFEFDTGTVDQGKLFATPTVTLKVTPSQLSQSLEDRFKKAMRGWTILVQAAKDQLDEPSVRFSGKRLEEMRVEAADREIPVCWLNEHPLFTAESHEKLYAELERLRQNDPIAYSDRIKALKAKESAIAKQLDHLANLVQSVRRARPASIELPTGTVVDAKDDPRRSFEAAEQREATLVGMLAARRDVADVEKTAEQALALYQQATEQAEQIRYALKEADKSLRAAMEARKIAITRHKVAKERAASAGKLHAKLESERRAMSEAEHDLRAGDASYKTAEEDLVAKRHLQARRNADNAKSSFAASESKFSSFIRACNKLDDEKRAFEAKLAGMQKARNDAADRINSAGGSASLKSFVAPSFDGPTDYAAQLLLLDQAERSWQQSARHQEDIYAAEQAAERSRRRSSYDSYSSDSSSSSSGSSWSGGDSSSGGGWGGGGDSSSGGGW